MKKYLSITAPALMAAMLAAPLAAANNNQGSSGSLGADVNVGADRERGGVGAGVRGAGANSRGDASGSLGVGAGYERGDNGGRLDAGVGADGSYTRRPTPGTTPGETMNRSAEASVGANARYDVNQYRRDYRGFARRLNKIERRIDKAEAQGRYTADEARRHRDDVQRIRAQFRFAGDASATKMSRDERSQLDGQIKAREEAVKEVEKR